MPEAHVTSALKAANNEGFELYVFELATTAVKAALEKTRRIGHDDVFKECMAAYYMHPKRPSAKEIAQVKIDPSSAGRMKQITLMIKRGHWVLADWMKKDTPLIYRQADTIVLESGNPVVERRTISAFSLP